MQGRIGNLSGCKCFNGNKLLHILFSVQLICLSSGSGMSKADAMAAYIKHAKELFSKYGV